MEANFAKVLNNNSSLIDLKRKRTGRVTSSISGLTYNVVPQMFTLSSSNNKRIKLDRERSKRDISGKSLIRYYTNFMKTGLPKRVMFYESGNWIDFPPHVVGLVQKALHLRNAAFEVEVDDHCVIFDFLLMIQLDLKSGSQKPIAWIDETNSCFFPENYTVSEESDESCQDEDEFVQPYGLHDMKLQLEIEINGTDSSKLKERSRASNSFVKQPSMNKNSHLYDLYGEYFPQKKLNESMEESQELGQNLVGATDHLHGKLDSERVRSMFFLGMSSENSNFSVLEIYSGSSSSLQARLELFQKQTEITQKYRGDANVRFAWLASSKEEVSSIMMYGLGHFGTAMMKPTFGTSVQLAAETCSNISVNCCDDDENGVRYVILCRVVLGKMEVVHPGSKQFHPTSEEFDSGVDDLENPRNYVVWNMNVNTHIYPEYVVCFKLHSNAKGYVVENEKKCDVLEVTSREPREKVKSDTSSVASGTDCHSMSNVERSLRNPASMRSNTPRVPKSPWMPFPMLLEAISMKLTPQDMKLLTLYYDLFKTKNISKADFVEKLREVVGDTLLKTTLINLQCKIPSKTPKRDVGVPEQQQIECDVISVPPKQEPGGSCSF